MTTQSRGNASATAKEFFDRYRAQDVSGMIALFGAAGVVEYVPLALEGPVGTIGPGSWSVLIDAFPNLTNEVKSIAASEDGRTAFVDVFIGGAQAKDAFGIRSQGKSYWLRHMFVIALGADGKIARVTSYWDSVDWYRQLGKTSVD